MFLIDTNVWMEKLLEQKRAIEVEQLRKYIPSSQLAISDFAFHSIGIILIDRRKENLFQLFIDDSFVVGSVSILSLNEIDLKHIIDTRISSLDFDDRYQFLVKEKFGLDLVTFDSDYKKSGIKVLSPVEAVRKFLKS